jgi:putative hydrolase of the HAD superfamily
VIRAVLFDLDETLLDRTASVSAFVADQHARFASRLGGASLDAFRDRFLALDARGSMHKSMVYPALLAEFGGDPDAAAELLDDYLANSSRHAVAMAGMDNLLSALRSRGLKLGIVSNGETALQWSNIDALGLRERMDVVLISETEGLRKPDAALFRRAAERLEMAASDCLFVGDNPVVDVLGARGAGMQAVWLENGVPWPEGETRGPSIRALGELLALPCFAS